MTVKRGGVDLSWPADGSTISVRYKQHGGTQLLMHVEAWDADIGLRDDLIGQVRAHCVVCGAQG